MAGREPVGLVERTVLLSLLAVVGEGVGQSLGRGGWVDLRRVVDVAGSGALAEEADHGLAALLEDLGSVHCGVSADFGLFVGGWELDKSVKVCEKKKIREARTVGASS